ncbi:MAG: UDP-N-acetylmuramoyl-tripeptide--D-alanyl-D-alanine ligase [Bacteroidales bacterium]|nr:UDP-N-acetylmuramoyl-tripeptide--D-alanyl-D-alanine ligase [Bacteroidales bacterium]
MEISELYEIFLKCGKVSTDSRNLQGGELFFALKGENFDGNEYALKAIEAGAAYSVVDKGSRFDGASERIIAVDNTLEALQALARHHRENTFVDGERIKVIGLTGTNGKTTTKELIRRVLSAKYNVTATEGNLNNDIGVPLSLLKIGPDTRLAVIEMGANHPDDILHLVNVAEPDYGLITNVGKAHLLGFGSFEGVKRAKGQLYDYIRDHGKAVFLNVDDPVLTEMAHLRQGLSILPYGPSYWNALVIPPDEGHPFLRMAIPDDLSESENLLALETSLAGSYNAVNVLAAIAVGRFFGVELDDCIRAIESYVPANSRSQMTKRGSLTLIMDAYNANPSSMGAALDNFSLTKAGRKVAMLGDMRELGEDSVAEHRAIVRRLKEMKLDKVFLVGEEFGKALEGSGLEAEWFPTSESLAGYLGEHPLADATVLVKGSRGIAMEKAASVLQ